MSDENPGEVKLPGLDIIKEFFTDVIRRIVPGAVVIALYFHKGLDCALNQSRMIPSAIVWVCIVTVAWGIGLVVETVPYGVLVFLQKKYEWAWCAKLLPREGQETHNLDRKLQKVFAEKVMCRSLGAISLFSLLSLLPWSWCAFAKPNLCGWSNWYGVLGLVIWFFCWYPVWIKGRDEANANEETAHHKTSSAKSGKKDH